MEYKCVICGSGGVGKSALTIKFIMGNFVGEYDPTIEDSYRKHATIDDEQVLIDILDTAGQEEYAAMRDQYLRNGQGFILTYSITSRISFDDLSVYRDALLKLHEHNKIPIILAGNKCDLHEKREVMKDEASLLAKEWDVTFYETSALADINVETVFFELVRIIKSQRPVFKSAQTKQRCTIF